MKTALAKLSVVVAVVCGGLIAGQGTAAAALCKVTSYASIYDSPGAFLSTGSVSPGDSWWEDTTSFQFGKSWSKGSDPYSGIKSGWIERSALNCN